MPTLLVGQREYEVDQNGYLQDPALWNEDVAKDFAEAEKIAMTDAHWTAVHYIRNYYLQTGVAPMIRKLCKDTGIKLDQLYKLFPSGPAKGACKIAGLPKPTGCV